jgi:hypothetical protein
MFTCLALAVQSAYRDDDDTVPTEASMPWLSQPLDGRNNVATALEIHKKL